MIIFDLDGTLADCEHRRHFVDPTKANCIEWINTTSGKKHYGYGYKNQVFKKWKPDWKSFYEACDQDPVITPTRKIINSLFGWDYYDNDEDVHIWSGRCESVRDKTENWLSRNSISYYKLKMRPIGDNAPDDVLKERWLDESLAEGKTIDYIFDDSPKVIRMYRRRGVFVFDCNQTGGEF